MHGNLGTCEDKSRLLSCQQAKTPNTETLSRLPARINILVTSNSSQYWQAQDEKHNNLRLCLLIENLFNDPKLVPGLGLSSSSVFSSDERGHSSVYFLEMAASDGASSISVAIRVRPFTVLHPDKLLDVI